MIKRVILVFIIFILCFSFPVFSSASFFPLDFISQHLELTFEQISSLFDLSVPSVKRISSHRSASSHLHKDGWNGYDSGFTVNNSTSFYNDFQYAAYSHYLSIVFDYIGYVPDNYHYIVSNLHKSGSSEYLSFFSIYYDYPDDSDFYDYTLYSNTNASIKCDSAFKQVFVEFVSNKRGSRFLISRNTVSKWTRSANTIVYRGGNFSNLDEEYCYLTDFVSDSAPFHFESLITQNGNDVRATIACILDDPDKIGVDVSGYKCGSGIVYHDSDNDIDGYPSSDYFFFDNVTAHYPEPNVIFKKTYSFNLKELEQFRKRKRLESFNYFYIYTNVIDEDFECVHYYDQLVDWSVVDDGIFSDVEDLPSFQPPDPLPFPEFPDFTFDYTPAATYNTYNYETINNYDTTQNFNEWMGDTLTTINNNISGGMDTIDHNIKATGDNITQYFEEIKNFIVGGFSDVNEYLGELIKKFNNDFNDWTVSFADYLHDLFDGLQKNLNIIADNIIEAIQLQTVPDKDVVFNICKSNLPMFDEFSSLFSDHDVSDSELIVAIPYLSNDNANGIELVTRELNTDGAVDVSRTLNSTSLPSLDGYYVFNVTATLTDPRYDFSKFRTVGSLIILGSTLFTLFNITLKCFGMHFGSLSSDDSGAKDS